MTVTAIFRYDAVRYSPIRSEEHPFQILSSNTEVWPFMVAVELTVTQAIDLYDSLGVMISGVEHG